MSKKLDILFFKKYFLCIKKKKREMLTKKPPTKNRWFFSYCYSIHQIKINKIVFLLNILTFNKNTYVIYFQNIFAKTTQISFAIQVKNPYWADYYFHNFGKYFLVLQKK